MAEAVVPEDGTLNKLYNECKDYIIATYQRGLLNEKLDDICKVWPRFLSFLILLLLRFRFGSLFISL